ncbi:hypothetical protein Hanom_Chr03g00182701 [Helianthus anomalus]
MCTKEKQYEEVSIDKRKHNKSEKAKKGLKSILFLQENKSKLLFWFFWFGHFCYFSSKFKLFASRFLWFQFYCHFGQKIKSSHICLIKSCYFVLFHRGKMIISFFFYK